MVESTEVIAKKMTSAKMEFAANAQKDYIGWDCNAMYPKPKRPTTLLDTNKWLGGISAAAKKAFGIYNMVKQYIPGGTVAGAGPVPGSDEMEYEQIELIGFKEVEGLGKALKSQLEEQSEDIEAAYQARVSIWS